MAERLLRFGASYDQPRERDNIESKPCVNGKPNAKNRSSARRSRSENVTVMTRNIPVSFDPHRTDDWAGSTGGFTRPVRVATAKVRHGAASG
jgi:hypothetical protein